MNIEIESTFVKSFIVKNKQERFISLLSSKKKRHEAIDQLCHNYKNIFEPNWLKAISKPNSDVLDLVQRLLKMGASGKCYCISSNDKVDSQSLSLEEAMKEVVGYGFPSIVICNPVKLAYFEAELDQAPPPRYFLRQ